MYLKAVGAVSNAIAGTFNFASGNTWLKQRGLYRSPDACMGTMIAGVLLGIVGGMASGAYTESLAVAAGAGTALAFLPAHLQAAHKAAKYDAANPPRKLTI